MHPNTTQPPKEPSKDRNNHRFLNGLKNFIIINSNQLNKSTQCGSVYLKLHKYLK